MEDNRDTRDTVVVEKDKSSPIGWIVGLVIVLILAAIFFMSGGFGLFGGNTAAPAGGDTINVDTPDSVNVQPTE